MLNRHLCGLSTHARQADSSTTQPATTNPRNREPEGPGTVAIPGLQLGGVSIGLCLPSVLVISGLRLRDLSQRNAGYIPVESTTEGDRATRCCGTPPSARDYLRKHTFPMSAPRRHRHPWGGGMETAAVIHLRRSAMTTGRQFNSPLPPIRFRQEGRSAQSCDRWRQG